MPLNFQILKIPLCASALLMTACGKNSIITAIEQDCSKTFSILKAEGVLKNPEACPCFAAKVQSKYSKTEQKYISKYMSEARSQIENNEMTIGKMGKVELPSTKSNLSAKEERKLGRRLTQDIDFCEDQIILEPFQK